MPKVDKTCEVCSAKFQVNPYRASIGGGKFCSSTCRRKSKYRPPVDNGDGTFSVRLTQGKSALVDAEDVVIVEPYTWSLEGGRRRYAIARVDGRPIKMHRLILGLEEGVYGDHINGDGLDNRRANLRIATREQNARNVRVRDGRRFKGVTAHSGGRFQVRVAEEHVGTFDTAEEAARVYNEVALRKFGRFARLNNITDGEK